MCCFCGAVGGVGLEKWSVRRRKVESSREKNLPKSNCQKSFAYMAS